MSEQTNVELAMGLRGEVWFPFHPADQGQGGPSQRDLEIIAWAAAVWLRDRHWKWDGTSPHTWRSQDEPWGPWRGCASHIRVQDPDPIRATLLAAHAAKGRT
jgi:hypothetical protein